jgi:uncharacterized protein
MVKRAVAPVGAPCWIDLFSTDTDRSRSFYEELFGWASASAGEEHGGYVLFTKDGEQVAGCMANPGEGVPDAWSVYLAVEDAGATESAAEAKGGSVIAPAMAVMELGSMLVVADPGGAAVGGWQPGEHKGFTVLAEPGTPVWFELLTRDYEAAVRFYEDVFRWSVHVVGDAPEFRYTTLGQDDEALAGVMDASAFLPEGVPAHWSVYFAVEDADAAIERAVGLGGTVVVPAEDTPYGRMAQLADPTGAMFKLLGPT